MIVRTSYGTGPYIIVKVKTSIEPSFIDYINMKNPPASPEHYTLTVRRLNSNDHSDYFLNGYNDDLQSVWENGDRLIVTSEETMLLNLILNI